MSGFPRSSSAIFAPRSSWTGHFLIVEIYRTDEDPGWVLAVENEFATLTVMDDPPFLADRLAWKAFETLVGEKGAAAFFTDKEKRKIRR